MSRAYDVHANATRLFLSLIVLSLLLGYAAAGPPPQPLLTSSTLSSSTTTIASSSSGLSSTTTIASSSSGSSGAATPLTSLLTSELCGIVYSIQSVVGVLALALFLIGGVMYAIAHFLPPSVDYRKNLIGWATAMITGGVIGLIVVIIAPMLVNMFAGASASVGGAAIPLGC